METKKKIAAMAAVLYYLQAEQEALEHDYFMPAHKPPPPPTVGFWSNSSRQAEMLQRSMVQMRQIPGWNK